MLRAAVWTMGLFAVGGGVAHFFPSQFTEPLVLIVLGVALFLASGRTRSAASRGPAAIAQEPDTIAPASRVTR